MAKGEGENADFAEFKPLGDDLGEAELFSQPAAAEDLSAAAVVGDFPEAQPAPEEGQKATAVEEDQTAEPAQPKRSLLETLGKVSPYTVMLGVALAAILVAVACLLLELNSYSFDVRASDYQQRAQ